MRSEALTKLISLLLLLGGIQLVYAQGSLDRAGSEFQETARQMQMAIDNNEKDLYADTLNYDTYKVAPAFRTS